MSKEIVVLTDEQKEAVEELDKQMKNLFRCFVRIDESGISISDAMSLIGMEIPLFARPALNQLSGRLREMREEVKTPTKEVA